MEAIETLRYMAAICLVLCIVTFPMFSSDLFNNKPWNDLTEPQKLAVDVFTFALFSGVVWVISMGLLMVIYG